MDRKTYNGLQTRLDAGEEIIEDKVDFVKLLSPTYPEAEFETPIDFQNEIKNSLYARSLESIDLEKLNYGANIFSTEEVDADEYGKKNVNKYLSTKIVRDGAGKLTVDLNKPSDEEDVVNLQKNVSTFTTKEYETTMKGFVRPVAVGEGIEEDMVTLAKLEKKKKLSPSEKKQFDSLKKKLEKS